MKELFGGLDVVDYYCSQIVLTRIYFLPREPLPVGVEEAERLLTALERWVVAQDDDVRADWKKAYLAYLDAFPNSEEGGCPTGWVGNDLIHIGHFARPASVPVLRTSAALQVAAEDDPVNLRLALVHAISGVAFMSPSELFSVIRDTHYRPPRYLV
ncbi:MAG: hypothetical protein AB7N76_20795 [Planctomycetota bacterium]